MPKIQTKRVGTYFLKTKKYMYLKGGRIPRKLYPGAGGTHSETIQVPESVDRLHAVMNGFAIEYNGGDNHIKKMEVDLHVHHTPGETSAELKCDFILNDENTSGDTFWAQCDYLLIGK